MTSVSKIALASKYFLHVIASSKDVTIEMLKHLQEKLILIFTYNDPPYVSFTWTFLVNFYEKLAILRKEKNIFIEKCIGFRTIFEPILD